MQPKRITLFAGHYGSGKTNLAVNYALALKAAGKNTLIADLDIVNPYFRTKDSEAELAAHGIRLICSAYANTNLDAPALPAQMYDVVNDRTTFAVMDIGGDDRGAYALGRYTPAIWEENDYEMLFVVNFYRPLTQTAAQALEVMREIDNAIAVSLGLLPHGTRLTSPPAPAATVRREARPAAVAVTQEVAAVSALSAEPVQKSESIG